MSAPDITVSAVAPLIINDPSTPTAYGTITIDAGGYIAIYSNCEFTCQKMIKLAAAPVGPAGRFSPTSAACSTRCQWKM